MTENHKSNKKMLYLVCGILFLQVVLFTFFFVRKKEFHSDEFWSYGIANSQDGPHIYINEDASDKNLYKWTDSDVANEYLTVQKNDRFDYKNVYKNTVIDKLSQPLYAMILHTICSFFPDTWSVWFLYPIQLISIIVSTFFFWLCLNELGLERGYVLAGLILFCFSSGGIDLMMYLRIYNLLVMFCNILLYLHIKMFKVSDFFKRDMVLMSLIVFLGTLTHIYFWVFAFIMGVFSTIILIAIKKYKHIMIYYIGMLSGVGGSLLFFPYLFNRAEKQVGNMAGIPTFNFAQQWRMSWRLLLRAILGVGPSGWYDSTWMEIVILIAVAFVFAFLIFFLLRNEIWFISAKKVCVNKIGKMFSMVKNNGLVIMIELMLCMECIVVAVITAIIVDYSQMNATTIRYFFCVFPSAVVIITSLFQIIGKIIFKKKQIVFNALGVAVAIGFVLMSLWQRPLLYLGLDKSEGTVLRDIKDSDIVILVENAWHFQCFAPFLIENNRFFLSEYHSLDDCISEIGKTSSEKEVYVVYGINEKWLSKMFAREYSNYSENNDIQPYEYEKLLYDYITSCNERIKREICLGCKGKKMEKIGSETMLNYAYDLYKISK